MTAAVIEKPRALTKNDLKRMVNSFSDATCYYHRQSAHPLSYSGLDDFEKALDEVLEIGFTGARRTEAMAHLRLAMTELYHDRFHASFAHAFTARYAYDFFTRELAPFGIEDKRTPQDRAEDSAYVLDCQYGGANVWVGVELEQLERSLAILEKEPIELTDADIEALKAFNYNPYGATDAASLRSYELELAAIARVEAKYDELSDDVKLLLGGFDGLESKRLDIVEGARSYGSSFRMGYYKEYRGRYIQARTLLAKEIAYRKGLAEAREALAKARRRFIAL